MTIYVLHPDTYRVQRGAWDAAHAVVILSSLTPPGSVYGFLDMDNEEELADWLINLNRSFKELMDAPNVP